MRLPEAHAYFIYRLIPQFLGLASYILILTTLNPSEFGMYASILTFTGFYKAIFTDWTKYYRMLLGKSTFLTSEEKYPPIILIFTLPVIFIIPIFFLRWASEESHHLLMIFLLISSRSIFEYHFSCLNAVENRKRALSLLYLRSAIFVFSAIWGFFTEQDFEFFIFAETFSFCLVILLFRIKILQNLSNLKIDFVKEFSYGFILSFINALPVMLSLIDKFILRYEFGMTAVGIYSAKVDLIVRVLSFPGLIAYSFYFSAVSAINSSQEFKSALLLRYCQFILCSLGLIIFIFFVFFPDILALFLNFENYKFTRSVIFWGLVVTLLLIYRIYFLDAVLSFLEGNRFLIFSSLFLIFAKVVLSIILVKFFGILGVLYGSGIALSIGIIFGLVKISRHEEFRRAAWFSSLALGIMIPVFMVCFFALEG